MHRRAVSYPGISQPWNMVSPTVGYLSVAVTLKSCGDAGYVALRRRLARRAPRVFGRGSRRGRMVPPTLAPGGRACSRGESAGEDRPTSCAALSPHGSVAPSPACKIAVGAFCSPMAALTPVRARFAALAPRARSTAPAGDRPTDDDAVLRDPRTSSHVLNRRRTASRPGAVCEHVRRGEENVEARRSGGVVGESGRMRLQPPATGSLLDACLPTSADWRTTWEGYPSAVGVGGST